jgi:hypothetical protein
MRRTPLLALALAAAIPGAVFAADAPSAEAPKPPTTTLPTFANPLHDAEIGETCLFKVHELGNDDGWVLYFEERVLARKKDRVLVETMKTDATGTKDFGIDAPSTGWRDAPETIPLPPGWHFLDAKAKDEVVLLGGPPPTKAVRARHCFIEYPAVPEKPDGAKLVRQVWYSHDIPVNGRAKQFPSIRDGERVAIAWDKKLSPEECARRAERFPDLEDKSANPAPTAPAMDEPPMGEPGMDEPPMGEPGMAEPPMGEPGMAEPGMDDAPMDGGMGG